MINVGNLISSFTKKTINKKDLADEDILEIVSSIAKPQKYINYFEKINFIKQIIKENVSMNGTQLKYDSCVLYYQFVCEILRIYYDLELVENTYDKLCSSKLFGYLMMLISDEYEMCKNILDSYMKDLHGGNLSLEDL